MSLTDAYIVKGANGEHRNENEYYPTPSIATLCLLKNYEVPHRLWEPAAGRGHIAKELARNGHEVVATDLYAYKDYLHPVTTDQDMLTTDVPPGIEGVITNPPFKNNLPEKLIQRVLGQEKIPFLALFCRLTFMESVRRYELFKSFPPSQILVFSGRIQCNEKYFHINHGLGGMVAYAWYVWDANCATSTVDWVRPIDYISDLGEDDV